MATGEEKKISDWDYYKRDNDILFIQSEVKKFIKAEGLHISQIDSGFWITLNYKIRKMLRGAVKNNGSRKRITSAELLSGSDRGIKKGRRNSL